MQSAHQAGEFAEPSFRLGPAYGQNFAFQDDFRIGDARYRDGFARRQSDGFTRDATGDCKLVLSQRGPVGRRHVDCKMCSQIDRNG